MEPVQIAIHNRAYATELRVELERGEGWDVLDVENPDFACKGLIVLDQITFDRVPLPLPDPERIVLVTANDSRRLGRAWEQGITSVVFDHESPHMAALAVLGASLRSQKELQHANRCALSPTHPAASKLHARITSNDAPSSLQTNATQLAEGVHRK
ncbi:MAG: hypothetical protein HYZ57_19660 [Acidobacteria bacterium]|nr:hypothetical protein [Acidobacteriota bacterium]MBI3282045.1 hypothetical protein [Acidobacteriota bacterium]